MPGVITTTHVRKTLILFVVLRCSLADAEDIWKSMLKKEAIYTRSSSYMTKHRDLQCRMRSLLIDWMMEVRLIFFILLNETAVSERLKRKKRLVLRSFSKVNK